MLRDCLELMKDIPDKSVDMILCDLPYGTTCNKWDSPLPLDEIWREYSRIIKVKLEYLIKTYTNKGEVVLDNCMSSGSTDVACKNLNRDFIGIELDDYYFQIAQRRINFAEIQA